MRAVSVFWLLVACSSGSDTPPRDAAAVDAATGGDATDASAASLSDDFDGTALDPAWTVLDASKLTIAVTGGSLRLAPTANALWYNTSRGGLIYKLVTGDFVVTSTVHARKTSNNTAPPDQAVQLGGLMARADVAQENYVFVVVGADETNVVGVEHKSTLNGSSAYASTPFSADAELRLCRRGTAYSMYRRAVGASTWTLDHQVTRADLGATLQVGLNAYTALASPDVTISFDSVAFDLGTGACDAP